MYLKRVTVTGFKSFASKTVLELEPGIIAIVGPNGSGKSNVADAIRWALGEQNKSRLRLNDREEVVFSGTQKRARASFAEVVLLFDNESGAFPLDVAEVQISRRLYRSGEAEYRLAGRLAKLSDIQTLMAEAGFGAGTYAVIGQGMIDSFLLSSPVERKALFDEAAGIRSSELKREVSLRQLAATESNLVRLRDITAELEPQLAALNQGMEAAAHVERLQASLLEARQRYVATTDRDLGHAAVALTERLDDLTLQSHRLRSEVEQGEALQAQQLAAAQNRYAAQAEARQIVATLEAELGERTQELARTHASAMQVKPLEGRVRQLEDASSQTANRLQKLVATHQDISADLADNEAAQGVATKAYKRAQAGVASAQAELLDLRESLHEGSSQKYVAGALQLLKAIAQGLNDEELPSHELRLLVHKAGRMLSHATKTGEAELLVGLKAAQIKLEAAMQRRETATEHQANITITCRSLELDEVHQRGLVTAAKAESRRLEQDLESVRAGLLHATSMLEDGAELAKALEITRAELARHRETLAHDAEPMDQAQRTAELAGRLERARGRLIEVTSQLENGVSARQRLQADGQELRTHMDAWAIESDPRYVCDQGPLSLREVIAKVEVELATRAEQVRETSSRHLEVKSRYELMAGQIGDLEGAQRDLGTLVGELDIVIRDRFKTNFARLSEEFGRAFNRLFEGGTATLELETGTDGEYGVIIKASPKGKRVSSLNALSGGERAMAGVALLAAIITVNPSPFVVLDEIDAALDEANAGRLASILDDLQVRSQLIVITHNRQTMRSAKALFGVTMDQDHVSRLLSVRLEEASALAAR